jgi:hypothetical protein
MVAETTKRAFKDSVDDGEFDGDFEELESDYGLEAGSIKEGVSESLASAGSMVKGGLVALAVSLAAVMLLA